jgi:hypothetical protein
VTDISPLNNTTFSELQSSLPLTIGNGITQSGDTYVASPNGIGLATYDNWVGVLGSPDPNDIVSYNLSIPNSGIGSTIGIIEYTFTQADGNVNPVTGGVGAEVIGWNSTGVLLEQLTGFVPGANPNITPDGSFLIMTAPGVDLSTTDGSGGATAAELTFSTSGPFPTFSTTCFAAGTRIACEAGEVAVEDLRVEDRVLLAGGGTSPIVWIGHRRIDCRRHADPDTVLPVRVAPGAFGEEAPRRPLFLSPEHAVFTGGVLIPIRLLMNGSSIRQVERETVTYYHVELEHHAVILAEGLAAESFLDTGNRAWFDNGPLPAPRGPERAATTWECLACAPLVLTGPWLGETRRLLSARAASLDLDALGTPATAVAIPADVSARCHIQLANS